MKNKIKTKKAVAKRIKITGKGKLKRYQSGKRHLLEHKNTNSKRNKRKASNISSADMNKVKKTLPGR
tara:strand:- start:177 stop:377 length:201 start_codon:yes stop_codon:yes gene_type:complete